MKKSLMTAAVISWVCAAGVAQADDNSFTGGSFRMTDQEARISLDAKSALTTPRISTEAGFVRVWFPNMRAWSAIDLTGDGQAIRFARVRPGVADTALVVVRVGDQRTLSEDAIRVERTGTHAEIILDRAALPAAAPLAAAPMQDNAQGPAQENAPAAAPVPSATTQAAATQETSQAPASAAQNQAAPTPMPLAGRPAPRATPVTTMQAAPSWSSNTTPLVLLTFVLGGVWIFARWYQSRRQGATARRIEVVATERIGPKSKLVIVRAMGQEHLLYVDGAHSERLASAPVPEETETTQSEASEPRSFLQLVRKQLSNPVTAAMAASSASEEAQALLRRAEEATREDRVSITSRVSTNPQSGPSSEAVSGILRLRAARAAR